MFNLVQSGEQFNLPLRTREVCALLIGHKLFRLEHIIPFFPLFTFGICIFVKDLYVRKGNKLYHGDHCLRNIFQMA